MRWPVYPPSVVAFASLVVSARGDDVPDVVVAHFWVVLVAVLAYLPQEVVVRFGREVDVLVRVVDAVECAHTASLRSMVS